MPEAPDRPEDAEGPEAPVVPDDADRPEVPRAGEPSDRPDEPDLPEAADVDVDVDRPEGSDVPGEPVLPEGPGAADRSEDLDVPEDADVPEEPGEAEAPRRPEDPEDPEDADGPEDPDVPEERDPPLVDRSDRLDGWLDRWTDGDPGLGFRLPSVVPVPVMFRPAAAVGRSATGPGSSSAGRTARSSRGPPGDAVRALPGRATPWMRPTGADGRTAWPSSPPREGSCHEASCERNRSPSLTPIEDRATVTDGGATRRQPPSQSPPPDTPAGGEGVATGGGGAADSSASPPRPPAFAPPAPRPPPSRAGAPVRCRSARRNQSPNPT
ncbi:hypothetical protein RI138_24385 [Streptomyces sp. C11-1]|uniref:Uncharacterized protein n=1 Tax=Streptomyces durocortorensis TaxID=2811104 RepID=A0ABY9W2N2_9ACTN|nr:hypothetical protein [Streptomyces durocortorensis]WNF29714.1 hypothetical protein RI138_24385 [Streptomyces durocortorensis]